MKSVGDMGLLEVAEQDLFDCDAATRLGEIVCAPIMEDLLDRRDMVYNNALWRGETLRRAQHEFKATLMKDTGVFVRVASKVLEYEIALHLRKAAEDR